MLRNKTPPQRPREEAKAKQARAGLAAGSHQLEASGPPHIVIERTTTPAPAPITSRSCSLKSRLHSHRGQHQVEIFRPFSLLRLLWSVNGRRCFDGHSSLFTPCRTRQETSESCSPLILVHTRALVLSRLQFCTIAIELLQ